MLVPKFWLDQNSESVIINIHSPYTNIDDTEIFVEDNEFVFSSPPYHLRLHLPGKIIENHKSIAKYDCEKGDFTFTFEKKTKGEDFENLDMITSLLAPKEMKDLNPSLIQVINDFDDNNTELEPTEDDQNVNPSLLNNNFSYGFANKLAGSFKDLGEEFPNIFELKTPEETSFEDRKSMREQNEAEKFSSDHYLADFFDEELIAPLLSFKTTFASADPNFKDEELQILKDLPNKEYLLSKREFNSVICNLVDILYSYCYEKRTTYSENTVESSWTINRLSATLSCFETFVSLEDTLICCYRRALIYPIYRNFKLCCKVKEDLVRLICEGRKTIVKCIIEIYKLFNSSQDARYILNQLYIRDFLIFSQKCSEATFKNVANEIQSISLTKCCLNLELEEYEEAGQMVQNEEAQILENATALMSALKVSPDRVKSSPKTPVEDQYYTSDSDDSSDSSSCSSSELDSDDDDEDDDDDGDS